MTKVVKTDGRFRIKELGYYPQYGKTLYYLEEELFCGWHMVTDRPRSLLGRQDAEEMLQRFVKSDKEMFGHMMK